MARILDTWWLRILEALDAWLDAEIRRRRRHRLARVSLRLRPID